MTRFLPDILPPFPNLNDFNSRKEQLTKVLLYRFSQLDQNQNRNKLNSSVNYSRIKAF